MSHIIGAAHLLNDNLRANHPHAIEALDLFLSTLPIAFTDMKDLAAIEKTFAPWREQVPEGWGAFVNRMQLRRVNAADMTREDHAGTERGELREVLLSDHSASQDRRRVARVGF